MLLPAPPDPALIAYNRRLAAFHHNLDPSSDHHPVHLCAGRVGYGAVDKAPLRSTVQWRTPTVANIPPYRSSSKRAASGGPRRDNDDEASRWSASRKASRERDRRGRRDESLQRRIIAAGVQGSGQVPAVAITFNRRASPGGPMNRRLRPVQPPVHSTTAHDADAGREQTVKLDEEGLSWSSARDLETMVTVRTANPSSSSREVSPDPSGSLRESTSSWLPDIIASNTSTTYEHTPPLIIYGDESYMEAVPMLSPCSGPNGGIYSAASAAESSRSGASGQAKANPRDVPAATKAKVERDVRRTLFPVEDQEEPVVSAEVWDSLLRVDHWHAIPTRVEGSVRRRIAGVTCQSKQVAVAEGPLSLERPSACATLQFPRHIQSPLTKRLRLGGPSSACVWTPSPAYIPYIAYKSTPSFLEFCGRHRKHDDLGLGCTVGEDPSRIVPRVTISVQMSEHGSRCFGSPAGPLEDALRRPDHTDELLSNVGDDPAMSMPVNMANSIDWSDYVPPPRRRSDGDLLRRRVLDWNLVQSGKVSSVRIRGDKEPRIRRGSMAGARCASSLRSVWGADVSETEEDGASAKMMARAWLRG